MWRAPAQVRRAPHLRVWARRARESERASEQRASGQVPTGGGVDRGKAEGAATEACCACVRDAPTGRCGGEGGDGGDAHLRRYGRWRLADPFGAPLSCLACQSDGCCRRPTTTTPARSLRASSSGRSAAAHLVAAVARSAGSRERRCWRHFRRRRRRQSLGSLRWTAFC